MVTYDNGLTSILLLRRVWRCPRYAAESGIRAALLVSAFVTCPCAVSATLSISNQTAMAGETIVAPIMLLSGGESIAAIQFDLQWNPSLAIQVTPGISPGQASKTLYTGPSVPGSLRCLIVGPNQATLGDGAVAEIIISVNSGASPGAIQLNVTNAIAASTAGESLPLQTVSGGLQILNGASLQNLPAQAVLNTASLLAGPIAPQEIVTVLGYFPSVSPTVLFNRTLAQVIYAGTNQLNVIVPFGLNMSGPADIQLLDQGQIFDELSIAVAPVAPAVFTQNDAGTGPCVASNPDSTLNSFLNPVAANSILIIYGTGFGLVRSVGNAESGTGQLVLPVSATIGGIPAQVVYAGPIQNTNLITSLLQTNVRTSILGGAVAQINIVVPNGLPSNPFTPIVLSAGSVVTQPGVTVSIR